MEKIRFTIGASTLGSILLAKNERGVSAILWGDDCKTLLDTLQKRFACTTPVQDDNALEPLMAAVINFIETPVAGLNLPLDISGTPFQQQVWQALAEIPCGSTASYSAIASRIGNPKAVRAVARACAANALALAIPCHRILRNDGGISGYRWGIVRKLELLRRESASLAQAITSEKLLSP